MALIRSQPVSFADQSRPVLFGLRSRNAVEHSRCRAVGEQRKGHDQKQENLGTSNHSIFLHAGETHVRPF